MPHYFKPLRRKIGVITLVLALVFAALWVRSFVRHGIEFKRKYGDTQYVMKSVDSSLYLHRLTPYSPATEAEDVSLDDSGEWSSFGFRAGVYYPFGVVRNQLLVIPHWSIVIPLTLLSAWLLLSKPKQPKPTTEPPV